MFFCSLDPDWKIGNITNEDCTEIVDECYYNDDLDFLQDVCPDCNNEELLRDLSKRGFIEIKNTDLTNKENVKNLVTYQARLASKTNLDGFVCSAQEAPNVKKVFKKEIITPGIRFAGEKAKDQKRITTPKKAFENGATSIVIGRSITKGNIANNIQRLLNSLN